MAKMTSKRSGVALIIVLGLIAILMIVSVAFSIHMRIERAGAANLRHAGVARQIVKGGMAAAMAAIDMDVGDNVVPPWYDSEAVTNLIYNREESWRKSDGGREWRTSHLWKNTLVSYDTNQAEQVSASIFSKEVEEYFPGGLAFGGYAKKYIKPGATSGGTEILQPRWLPVYSDKNEDSVMGRFAFFAIDTTGMLDVCCMTNGASKRWMGRYPGEMAVLSSLLPDVTDAGKFADENRKNGTYVSLAELQKMNPNIDNCQSFNTFSYDPGPLNDLVYIGGSATDLRNNKDKIIAAFYDCGLTAGKSFGNKDCEQARWAYLGLVDYVDGDDKMEDDDRIKPWQRPATENLPLMSGFIAILKVECRDQVLEKTVGDRTVYEKTGAWEMKLTADFRIPFVYPFVKETSAPAAKLEGKATFMCGQNGGEYPPALFPYGTFPDDPKRIATGTENFDNQPDDDNLAVHSLEVGSEDWCELGGFSGRENNTKPPRLDDPQKQLHVVFFAAGQTTRAGEVQHRYPLNQDDYNSPDGDTWMATSFDFKQEQVDFDNDPVEEKIVGKDKDNNDVTQRRWEKQVVAWAEVLDPRFASLDMEDRSDRNNLWPAQRKFYRQSHCEDDEIWLGDSSKHYSIPITKLKSLGTADAKSAFASFSASPTVGDFDAPNTGNLGEYFHGNVAQNGGVKKSPYGASPLTSYVLTHPAVSEKVYRMNLDGVRLADGESKDTTDRARMKWRAYVKNAPLESVGELAYLPIGIWYTIRLYDYGNKRKISFNGTQQEITRFNHLPSDDNSDNPPFHPVLDYFTVIDYEKETVRGRVNVNTLNENVLATAFYSMPVGTEFNEEEGQDSSLTLPPVANSLTHRIDENGARDLAEALVTLRNGGDLQTLSDLGYMVNDSTPLHGEDVESPAILALMDRVRNGEDFGEFERESLIRNSCGLFTTRGQTFIVAVRGESYSPMYGHKRSLSTGTCNASKTAVAQIWRDSEPDEDGKHPMFIQFFKIIDD